MSPAPLQIAYLIKAGMSSWPWIGAGTTDWQAWGILVARLVMTTLISCGAIGESDNDARRIRMNRLVLRSSCMVLIARAGAEVVKPDPDYNSGGRVSQHPDLGEILSVRDRRR